MAKLPDWTDVGAAPQLSGARGVGSYDVSGLARGQQALARGGEALGKGIGELGTAVAEVGLEKNRWDYHTANADFLTKKIDLEAGLAEDRDYPTLKDRYETSVKGVRDKSAELIADPRMRERFLQDTAPTVEQGIAKVQAHARALQGEASRQYVIDQGESLINKSVSADDSTKAAALTTYGGLVDAAAGRGFITPQQAAAEKKTFVSKFNHADVLARIDRGDAQGALDDLRRSRAAAAGDADSRGHHYEALNPLEREQLIGHAEQATHKADVDGKAELAQRSQDAQSEALSTGNVTKPIAREEFTKVYGAADGERRFQQYDTTVQTGRTIAAMADMTPEQRGHALEALKPVPGEPGFAVKEHAYGIAQQAAAKVQKDLDTDPAGFAMARLPAAGDAWKTFAATVGDPKASDEDRAAAARRYATVTQMEQARVGVPAEAQRVVPKSYVDHLAGTIAGAANSDEPQKRIGLVGMIQREAAMWGENWPAVMRELAPGAQPIVRAIAAGADPAAMTRLLSVPKDENPAKILKEQNETKFKDVTSALNTAMEPFRRSLVGRQLDRDYPGYYGLGEKLAALYVRDGKSASDAAAAAFKDLLGNRYEFKDTWRMPKSAGVDPADVQKGTVAARQIIRDGGAFPTVETSFDAATKTLGLNEQEQALYRRHLTNLTSAAGVDNPDGSRSTLFQMSFERDGKTYNVPTVWDGKILKPDAAIKRAEAEGLDKFPSYPSGDQAEGRYRQMHGFMEQDTARFLAARKASPLANIAAAADEIGLENNRGDSLAKFARDGKFVTAHDNSGLNLFYDDKLVRTTGGAPVLLTWAQLADLAKGYTKPAAVGRSTPGIN